MKVKKVEIGFRSIEEALNDFVATGEAIMRGEQVKKHEGVYFTNYEALRKAIDDNLWIKALEAFEDQARAIQWFITPSIALGDMTPVLLLKEPEGRQRVLEELLRIKYGL